MSVVYIRVQMYQKVNSISEYFALERQNADVEFGRNLDLQIQKILGYKESILQTFVHQDELVAFVQKMEIAADQFGVEISIENVDRTDPVTISENYKVRDVKFRLNLSGPYDQIKNFIETLSKFENEILVQEFRLYRTREENRIVYNARVFILTKEIQYDKK